VRSDCHPNVCRVQMPGASTIGILLVNIVVNPFYKQPSCVILMGGSYLESGDANRSGSWVHLERTMKKIELRWEGENRNVFDRPKEFVPDWIPEGYVILTPVVQVVSAQVVR